MRWLPVTLVGLLVLIGVAIGGRVILVPLLSSLALAYLLAPVVVWFARRGWSRPASVLLTMTAATLTLALVLIFILPSFWHQFSTSYTQAKNLMTNEKIDRLLLKIKQVNPQIYELAKNYDLQAEKERIGRLALDWLQRGLFKLVDLTTSILDLLLIPFFVYYLLADYGAMRERVDRLVPPRFRGTTSELLSEVNNVVSSYVRSQLVIGLVMGALYSLGFLMLRVPMAITIGMLSGLLNFVPYLGTLTGLLFSLAFAALDGAGPGRLVGVLAVFVIVQSVEAYYLTPRFLGSNLDLHPMWVLVGLMIGGSLFGLLGIILAVPVIAIAKVVMGFLEELYQQSDFYRDPGVNLLTDQGRLVELTESASPSGLILEENLAGRPRRAIITTAELRSRIQTSPSTDLPPDQDD